MARPKLPMMVTESGHGIDISRSSEPLEDEPCDSQIESWLMSALGELNVPSAEVSLRVVSEQEMTLLNKRYRGVDGPTNVLSFPAGVAIVDEAGFLGDIAICNTVVHRESHEYNKSFKARFAHMVIHGLLHLLGFDHVQPEQRDAMEAMEVRLLIPLGILDPYEMEPES